MDKLTRAFYEKSLENEFRKKRGKDFQDFFNSMMEFRYPGDFIRTRPWGKQGDQKNDGYLPSKRTLFAVYAPNEIEASVTVRKITSDLEGALPHWKAHFDRWSFVHNSMDGLPPDVTKLLLKMGGEYPEIKITPFSYVEFRGELFQLPDSDIAVLLGNAPNAQTFANLSYENLSRVLSAIALGPVGSDAEIRPVPRDKIRANQLSASIEILLKAGMSKADLVGKLLKDWPEPEYGDSLARAFSAKYQSLKKAHHPAELIFTELQEFAGGNVRKGPDHEAAVLAVLAFLFEQCEIYERPPDGN